MATPKQQKWSLSCGGYEYEIVYKPGRENSAADSLSREVGPPTLWVISEPQFTIWAEIRRDVAQSQWAQEIMNPIEAGLEKVPDYEGKDRLLWYKEHVAIPPDSTLKSRLLQEFHDTKSGGHSRVL